MQSWEVSCIHHSALCKNIYYLLIKTICLTFKMHLFFPFPAVLFIFYYAVILFIHLKILNRTNYSLKMHIYVILSNIWWLESYPLSNPSIFDIIKRPRLTWIPRNYFPATRSMIFIRQCHHQHRKSPSQHETATGLGEHLGPGGCRGWLLEQTIRSRGSSQIKYEWMLKSVTMLNKNK